MPKPLQPEARIGAYELVRRIGVGGMAEVWVARRVSERRANKYVAIKVVADQHVGDSRFQRMFKAEVELSALLNHVNIVQVFDEGDDDGRSYLVMEWIDGVNLLKVEAALTFIDDEPWRLKVISYVVGQLLYALHYAHSITLHDGNPLGIVHRDVSPQNVLVSTQGEVKLTDFGVAHYLLEESSGVHVKGKLRYMAPEQLAGRTRDPRLDLYAVGAILHELLDGQRFRHHVTDQRAMYIEIISGQVPSLSHSVPPELEALRLGLLEPDIERRIPSADAALEQLARLPGYGDARRELTQLCGGLTGVMRPRVGPGRSEMVVAAPSSVAAPVVVPTSVRTVVGDAGVVPMRSKTLRVASVGDVGYAPPSLEHDLTQPWMTPAFPDVVSTSPSVPMQVAVEATDSMALAAARDRAQTMDGRSRPSTAPPAWWIAFGLLMSVALLGTGAWWVRAQWARWEAATRVEREPEPLVLDERIDLVRDRSLVDDPGADGSTDDATTGAVPSEAVDATTGPPPGNEVDGDEPSGKSTKEVGLISPPSGPIDPPRPRPRPRQSLSIATVASLGPIQVEVRSKDGKSRKKYALPGPKNGDRLPIGSYVIKWRSVGASQWSKDYDVELRRGCDLRLVIGPTGVRSVQMGAGCH